MKKRWIIRTEGKKTIAVDELTDKWICDLLHTNKTSIYTCPYAKDLLEKKDYDYNLNHIKWGRKGEALIIAPTTVMGGHE